MPKKNDLTGKRFGKLRVLGRTESNKKGVYWNCVCDCGNKTIVESSQLKRGKTKSCGCLRKCDLLGQKFGRLTVVKEIGRDKRNNVMWLCKCDCGNEVTTSSNNLSRKHIESCGCLNLENNSKKMKVMLDILKGESWVEDTALFKIKSSTIYKNNTSGVKGVSWNSKKQQWIANIGFQKKRYFLGCFNTIEEAAQAREEAEKKYFKPILEKYNIETE